MAVNPNTDFTVGQVATAAQMNRFPRGVMGSVNRTSNYTLTAVDTLVTGMTITFTAVANRLYKASFHGLVTKTTAAGETYVSMNKTVGGTTTTVGVNSVYSPTSTSLDSHDFFVLVTGLAAGTTTVFASASYGTNGGVLTASATNISYIVVEDLGPA